MVASQNAVQETQNDMYCSAVPSPYAEYYPDSHYYVPPPHPAEMCPTHHTQICTVHSDYGPVTVPMVSTNSSPPIAMPVQVPPGHVVQQIVDESGTLRHVILSPQPPLVAMPHNPQHYGGPGNGNSQPPQTFYAQGLAPGYGTAAAHYMGAGGGHLGHVGGGGGGHLGHSPPPAHPFHKDERTQRQYNKLKRKLEQKRSDVSGSGHSTPLLSPRKELVNGLRRGAAATAAHKERGMNSVGTSEDGEESSSVQDDEDEVNVITDILSSVQSPQVSELSSRSALLQWSVPARLSAGTTTGDHDLDISESELRYDVLLSDKGKEGKYKSIYSGAARSCRIEDLRPGHEYSVCVQVHLDELQGAASDPLTFTTPACEPDQPLPPRLISRTKTSLQLRWAAPNDNGSPVHQYVLECDEGKGAGFVELTKHRGRQFHMTKLQPSTVYRFRLTAVNECGRSACSDMVSFATAGSPPAPPAPPHLEHAAVDSLRLVWSRRPSDDSFTLQMDSVHTGYGFMNEYVGKDTEYVCKNLARYSDYRFRLRAHSDEAAGAWSEEVCYRTLAAPPSTPSRPTVKGRPHAHSFKVRWEPPSDRGGADLTAYILELSSGSAFEQVYSGTDTEAVCDKLSAGTTYQVRVSCVGVGGRSAPSEPCTVTTEPVCPGKCTALRVHGRARATAMTLRWTEPDFSGGAPLAEYELELLDPRRQLYRGREPEHTVTDLQPGTTYSFAVRAVNRAGHGPWSDVLTASSGAAPPEAPAAPTVTTRSPHCVLVEWAEPTTNGAPITEYRLEMSTVISQQQQQHDEEENAEERSEHEQQNQQQESTFSVVYTGIATSHELRSLAPFTTYFFRVQAVNAAGPSLFSSVGAALTPATVPAAPGVPRYEATATTLHLQWSEPAAHGSPIEHYIVEVGERAERTPDSVPECTVERLRPDTVFRVRVKAVNGIGVGPCSASVRAATLPLPPPPPRLECLATGHNYLKLKWGDGRNADFTHYTLEMEHSRSKEFVCVYQGTNLTYKLNKLQELTAYRFRICATSDAGQGDYSDVCEFRTCVAPPATLKAPRVSDLAQRSALVEWLPCRMPTPDPIHYTLHLTRLRDQDFKQVYRGAEVKHTLTDLEAGVEYSVKVCPVRICAQGTELAGAFSPATTFATVAPEPVATARTTAPTASGSPARGRKNQRLLSWLLGLPLNGDKRPITDTQWAILILVGFTLFAILAAVVVERLINWRKAV